MKLIPLIEAGSIKQFKAFDESKNKGTERTKNSKKNKEPKQVRTYKLIPLIGNEKISF